METLFSKGIFLSQTQPQLVFKKQSKIFSIEKAVTHKKK